MASAGRQVRHSHTTPAVRQRLLFLVCGNLGLLAYIFWQTLGSPNASFVDELSRFAPNVAPYVIAGLGLTGIICTGAIDLSIGAIIVVAGTVFGIGYEWGYSPLVCYAACYLTAVGLSAANGYVIRLLSIPAIIVTLAGLVFYRGAALILADVSLTNFGGQISVQDEAYHAPGKEHAALILLAALVVAAAWEAFGKTPRTWLALGDSEAACRLKGLHPGKVLQSSFWASGLFLGLASVTYVTNRLTIEPSRMARGFELDVIGAVVLGGTNIFGGEGSLIGTALGAFFLYLVGQTMLYAGVGEYWRTAVQGAVIVAVIGFDCWAHRREKLLKELQ